MACDVVPGAACAVLAYLIGGVNKAIDFPGAVAEQAHFGLQPAWAWAIVTIVVELGGSLLLIWRPPGLAGRRRLGVLTAISDARREQFLGHGRPGAFHGDERFL